MSFMDKLKAKAEELGLDEKAAQAKEKAAEAAGTNRDKIAGAVGKAGQAVDAKTGGKYSDKISKAQDAALKGVDKVAEQGSAAGTHASGTTTGSFGESAVDTEHAYDADLAGDADLAAGHTPETATRRTVGQDGMATADDQSRGESPVERAIGADATTSSLDPNTSFQNDGLDAAGSESDFGGTQHANMNADGETPERRAGDAPQS